MKRAVANVWVISLLSPNRKVGGVVLFLFFSLIWPSHVACGILAPRPRVKLASLELKAERLNHWTARAVPSVAFKEEEFLGTL